MSVVLSCGGNNPIRGDSPATIPFDGERAFGYLEEQVAFGPRVPGTAAHDSARDWIVARLREHTAQVSFQQFTGRADGRETAMQNILCSFFPENPNRVLLCAHWDSRSRADRDPDPANHDEPVPGANDGASGVAVLLEAAAVIAAHEPDVGVDIVFFDGEDDGEYGLNETWLLGSRHFARAMPAGYRPSYAVLIDMIGDRDLRLSRDSSSEFAAPVVWGRVLDRCAELGIPVDSRPISVLDDHIPLIERGIPAVDLIDFEYPYWHTVSDTPDKCSAESLEKIGRLVLSLIYGE
jgi:hypothetical protein